MDIKGKFNSFIHRPDRNLENESLILNEPPSVTSLAVETEKAPDRIPFGVAASLLSPEELSRLLAEGIVESPSTNNL